MKRKISIVALTLIMLSSLLICACTSKKDSSDSEPELVPSITVSAATMEITEGDTFTLTAAKQNSDAEIVWSVSDESKVEILGVKANGNTSEINLKAENATKEAVNVIAKISDNGKEYKAICAVTVQDSNAPLVIVNGDIVSNSVSLYVAADETDTFVTAFTVHSGSASGKIKTGAKFVWQVAEGNDDIAEITSTDNEGEFVFSGKVVGTSKYILFAELGEKTCFYELNVVVKEKTPSLVFTNTDVIDGALSKRLKTVGEDKTFIPAFDIKYGFSTLDANLAKVRWSVEENDKITVNETTGEITAITRTDLAEKKYVTVTATLTYGSATFTNSLNVYVDAPEKQVAAVTESIETYNSSNTIEFKDLLEGDTANAELSLKNLDNGNELKGLFAGYSENKITLSDGVLNIKTEAKYLGTNVEYTFKTSLYDYKFTLPSYTKIIKTKADLGAISGFNGIADSAADDTDGKIFGGYFVLANDIEYNGVYTGMCGGAWFSGYNTRTGNGDDYKGGFNGVFDGNCHYIKGISFEANADYCSFITTIKKGGVIKNIAFLNAETENSAFLTAHSVGTHENVYIQYDRIKFTKTNGWEHVAVSFDVDTTPAEYIHCFVDASNAKLEISDDLLGKTYLMSKYTTLTECYGVCGKGVKFADSQNDVFSSEDLKANKAAQTVLSESFDENFWLYIANEGRVAPLSCYDENAVLSIGSEDGKTEIISGMSLKLVFSDNKAFMVFALDAPEGVSFDGEKIITENGVLGEGKLTAYYLYDSSKTAEFEFTVAEEQLFTVTYVDETGATIHTEQVKSGNKATYTLADSREGDVVTVKTMYDQNGNKLTAVENVSSDMTITVKSEQYQAKKINITAADTFSYTENTDVSANENIIKTTQVVSSTITNSNENTWLKTDLNYGNYDHVFFYVRVSRNWGKMPKFAAGWNVFAGTNFITSTEWVKVDITKNANGTYDVVYSDGQSATNVSAATLYMFVCGSNSADDYFKISEAFCKI